MAPRFWCPAGISGLLPTPTCLCPFFPHHYSDRLTTLPCVCLLPIPSPWMDARSESIMQASLPGEPEGVPLEPMGVVAATLEVVETKDMEVEDMTADLEDMDMDMVGPETIVAARVAMTATQEEITETIMTTEMGHAHKIYTRNNTSDPGSSLQIAVFIKIFGAALKRLF